MESALLKFLICPKDHFSLKREQDNLKCKKCQKTFLIRDKIPQLFYLEQLNNQKDITKIIKQFYEETPFPNYDDVDSRYSLRKKAEEGIFARMLDEQLPYKSKILEVGCGTGQLTNFLAMTAGRLVIGADICLNSLKLANKFKLENKINSFFVQMNLFNPCLKENAFDVVICSGVLHHTDDPYRGFEKIATLVKPGGIIIIGLYHKFGRVSTDIRRIIFSLTGNKFQLLDPRIRKANIKQLRKNTWFRDQYQNPHESKHTFGEILNWFEKNSFVFLNSIPSTSPLQDFNEYNELFETHKIGDSLERFLVETGMLFKGSNEGGYFIMIGKRK